MSDETIENIPENALSDDELYDHIHNNKSNLNGNRDRLVIIAELRALRRVVERSSGIKSIFEQLVPRGPAVEGPKPTYHQCQEAYITFACDESIPAGTEVDLTTVVTGMFKATGFDVEQGLAEISIMTVGMQFLTFRGEKMSLDRSIDFDRDISHKISTAKPGTTISLRLRSLVDIPARWSFKMLGLTVADYGEVSPINVGGPRWARIGNRLTDRST